MRMSIVMFRCFKVPVRYRLILFYLSYSFWWLSSSSRPRPPGRGLMPNLSILILVIYAKILAFSKFEAKGRFFKSAIEGMPPSSVSSFGLYEAESPNPKFKFAGRLFGLRPYTFDVDASSPVNFEVGVPTSIGCMPLGLILPSKSCSCFCLFYWSNFCRFGPVIGCNDGSDWTCYSKSPSSAE